MASDAADPFPGVQGGAAAHGLDHHAIPVQQLEIDEFVRGQGEVGGAILLDRDGAEDALVVEVVPVHAGPFDALAAPARLGPEPLLRGLHDPEEFHAARFHPLHVGAAIDVLDVEVAIAVVEIAAGGDLRRARVRGQRHGVVAPGPLGVEEDFVAEDIQKIDAHLFPAAGHAGAEEVFVREGPGILVFGADGGEAVETAIWSARFTDEIDGAGGPGLLDGQASIHALLTVQNGEGTPGTVMAGTEDAEDLFRSGDGMGIQDDPPGRGVVPVVERMAGAIGVDRPEPLGVSEIAVHIFPAVVDDAPIRQEGSVPLHEGAFADLVDVCPIRLHAVQVPHDVDVTHAVFGLARGGEEDVVIGQVKGVDVEHPLGRGEGFQPGAIRADFVDVVVVPDVFAHGEEDFPAVEVDIRIAQAALGAGIGHHACFPVAAEIDGLQRAARLVAGGVAFTGLEHRFRVVMVGPVLAADDVEDGLSGDEGICDEGVPPQLLKGISGGIGLLRDPIQFGQECGCAWVSGAERGGDILDGAAQGGDFAGGRGGGGIRGLQQQREQQQ